MLCVGNASTIITSINSIVVFTQIVWPSVAGSVIGAFNEAVVPVTVPVPAAFDLATKLSSVVTYSTVIWKCSPLKTLASSSLSSAVWEPLLTITFGVAKVASKLSVATDAFCTKK